MQTVLLKYNIQHEVVLYYIFKNQIVEIEHLNMQAIYTTSASNIFKHDTIVQTHYERNIREHA